MFKVNSLSFIYVYTCEIITSQYNKHIYHV